MHQHFLSKITLEVDHWSKTSRRKVVNRQKKKQRRNFYFIFFLGPTEKTQ